MSTLILLCAILLTLLQVADYLTTYKAITSGKGTEGNPFVQFFIRYVGLVAGLLITKFWAAGIIWYGVCAEWYLSAQGIAMLSVVSVFYSAVVINNYKIIRR